MNKNRVFPSFAILALLLAGCGEKQSATSFSSSSEYISPSAFFSLFQSSGEAYYRNDDIGSYSNDFSGQISGVTKGSDDVETAFDATADNLVIDSRFNNINSTSGSDLDAYLVFDGGPVEISSGSDEGVAYKWTNFRPRLYLDDGNLFMDLSENPSLRLAINWFVRLQTGDSTWTFPQSGLGYTAIDSSILDEMMPLGGRFDDQVAGYRQAFEDAYADYPGDFTLTLKDGIYTIVYSTTDKTHIRDFVIEEAEKENSDWTPQEKEELETAINNLANAATVNRFAITFTYTADVWLSRTIGIDIDFDLATQKTAEPDQNVYPTVLIADGVFDFVSGAAAKIVFPTDMDTGHYTQLAFPSFDLWGGLIG